MTVVTQGELRVANPATLETVGVVPAARPAEVGSLVAAARGAQAGWAEAALGERRALLRRLSEVLLDRSDEIADVVVAETAKPRIEAFTTEVFPALDTLAWLAAEAPTLLAPERVRFARPHLLHKRGRLLYEPLGVVAIVSPWNFPFAIPFTQAAYAVAAGNGVVLKPSELTPLTGALVARLFADAGAPRGLVQVAQGDGEVGAAVVVAGVDKIVFTGSTATGRKVAAAAGECLTPVTLELGGKDPMLVLDDADLARAVDGALWGSFVNCGQVCSGVERIYVEDSLYEPFLEELARRAGELELGTEVGPLISEAQRDRVAALVDDAVSRGARAHAGGRVPDRVGWFYEPTVLSGVDPAARVQHDEIFGPVVTVTRAVDEAAAISAANDAELALGASVWTRDAQRAERVASRLRAGSVWHNDHAYSYGAAAAAWGGRGASGFGRTHSKHGLYALVNVKFVDRDSGRVGVPWWFPYDDTATDAFRGVLGAIYGTRAAARVGCAWRNRAAVRALLRRYRR
jgi:succinate-semialdehyde dehydrogenase/glutarate-semialdehyde dehydrogenase